VIVEDDPRLADNLSELLRSHGLAAVTAASVLETERLGPVKPCCALVDLRVPGGPDGEAMRRLAEKYPSLPMLVVTAHDQVTPPVPHAGYFRKPFDTGQLLAAVEKFHAAHAGGAATR
jgi:two-component system, response regulator PdtaR